MTPLLLRTANRWKIPRELALAVIARDIRCIYCNREFGQPQGPRAACASWEHIVNDETLINTANVALCCVGCNASKGTKPLKTWISSSYCKERGISSHSLAKVAADALAGQ